MKDKNYEILYKLLDSNCVFDYEITDLKKCQNVKGTFSKSECYDYLLEHNLIIDEIAITPNYNFRVYAK